MRRFAVTRFIVIASIAGACGDGDDNRTEATQYALDPIPCLQDSDCCVVNDDCKTTAYVVHAKDSGKATSLVASADNSTCTKCITPRLQVSCGPAGTCVGERIDHGCALPMPYPGNHCGRIDLPASCVASTSSDDGGTKSSDGGSVKPLAVFACGG
jgi:hypothetical protein